MPLIGPTAIGRSHNGFLTAYAEEEEGDNFYIDLDVSASHVDKKDFFGKSDPYLEVFKTVNGSEVLLHRTETIMKTLNPHWRPFSLESVKCGGLDNMLTFKVWDWNKNAKPDYIGEFKSTLEELNGNIDIINSKKLKKK